MPSPFIIFWRALKLWWGEIYNLLIVSLLWTLGTLLVITAPPAAAALHALARRAVQGESVGWAEFFPQFGRYFWPSWGLALCDTLILMIIAANYRFWGRFAERWVPWVQGVWGAIFLVWLVWQLYLWPALVAPARPHVGRAMRNAFGLLLNAPLQSLGLALFCLALLLVSAGVVFPLFMATPAIIAVACNVALLSARRK